MGYVFQSGSNTIWKFVAGVYVSGQVCEFLYRGQQPVMWDRRLVFSVNTHCP